VKEGKKRLLPWRKTLVKGAVNPNFKWQSPESKSLKKGSIGKNLMAEEKMRRVKAAISGIKLGLYTGRERNRRPGNSKVGISQNKAPTRQSHDP